MKSTGSQLGSVTPEWACKRFICFQVPFPTVGHSFETARRTFRACAFCVFYNAEEPRRSGCRGRAISVAVVGWKAVMAAVPAVISFLFMLWDMWQVGSRPAGSPEVTGSPQVDTVQLKL